MCEIVRMCVMCEQVCVHVCGVFVHVCTLCMSAHECVSIHVYVCPVYIRARTHVHCVPCICVCVCIHASLGEGVWLQPLLRRLLAPPLCRAWHLCPPPQTPDSPELLDVGGDP